MHAPMTQSLKQIIRTILQSEEVPSRVLSRIYLARIKKAGIRTTAADLKRLDKSISKSIAAGSRSINVPFSKERLAGAKITIEDLQKIFALPSEQEIDKYLSKLAETLPKAAMKAAQGMSNAHLRYLKTNGSEILSENRQQRTRFEHNLRAVWGEALDQLEMMIGVARDIGAEIDRNWRNEKRRRRTTAMVLAHRFHARSICMADEVLALLRSGFASGAIARWRSLHELAVIATVVAKFGEDIVERYLAHTAVTRYQATLAYQEHAKALGMKPVSASVLARNLNARDQVVHRYGRDFKEAYGWASKALSRPAKKFEDIEMIAGFSALRPYYKHASKQVHGGAQGTLEPEGLRLKDRILLAGPSNYGLADPGQLVAHSLAAVTRALMISQYSFDTAGFLGVMDALAENCGRAFNKAHKRVQTLARLDDKHRTSHR